MIIMRGILLLAILLIVCLQAPPTRGATYYISPTGSDANPGTSTKPWLTFAYALNTSRVWCGDILVLLDGIYGDGTGTGKINLNNVVCTSGNELIITAQNQRKAKIVDNGTSVAVKADNSAYLTFDGLYATSTDNPSSVNDRGRPFEIFRSNHIILKNSVAKNPNRYANATAIGFLYSHDILVEDNETYVYHRHCTAAVAVERMVVRRQYCNPRGGRISGGFGTGPLGSGDSVFSMYPCKDCILENSIHDGTTSGGFLSEMNATFKNGVLQSGSKVLGSICYKCNYGNGIYPNGRNVADLNHTPQNITIRDVALVDYGSTGNGIRCSDCVNATIDHVTVLGTGVSATGILADDSVQGAGSADNSVVITNSLVSNVTTGFRVTGYNTWSVDKLFSNGNRTAFNPSLPSSKLINSSTETHGMGTCKIWVPAGAAIKGAGTGGSDIGANILYRYVNGVLTSTPLWAPRTGEFPHGAPDLDGTNRVAGESLFDIHRRLNVNTGGCAFPINYGNGNPDTSLPAAPVDLRAS